MERKNLTQMLSDMKKLWDDYKYNQYWASRELQQGHGGAHQQRVIHCQHVKKKMNFLKHQIIYRISKSGTKIKYKMGNKTYIGTFPSLSKDDAITYIELMAMVSNCPLEILEIQEIKFGIKESQSI